ncbi:hypothetical protein TcBrA4_0065090 [Trypanosoma cruzi]|nr:hypothetical protein TcBrA4_0065090 [Trypanosoma cruzi]
MRHQPRRSPAVRTRRRPGEAPPAAPAVCGGSAGWRYLPPEMKTNVSESHDALSGVGQREESTVNGSKGKAQMLMAPVTVGRLELVPKGSEHRMAVAPPAVGKTNPLRMKC